MLYVVHKIPFPCRMCKCTEEHIYWYRETMHAIEQCLAFAQLSFFLRTVVATILCTGASLEKTDKKAKQHFTFIHSREDKWLRAVYK